MAQRRTPPTEPPEPRPETIRVVLVEPLALVGAGMREVIDGEPDMEVVAEVRTAGDALAAVEESAPDIVLMDVELQEPAASAATRRLTQDSGSAVVVVGGDDDDASIMDAIEIGATAHVAAAAEPAELVAVIRRVAEGEDPLHDEVVARPTSSGTDHGGVPRGLPAPDSAADIPLTPRELEVLREVAAGLQATARSPSGSCVTEQTVKNHLSRASCTSSASPTGPTPSPSPFARAG